MESGQRGSSRTTKVVNTKIDKLKSMVTWNIKDFNKFQQSDVTHLEETFGPFEGAKTQIRMVLIQRANGYSTLRLELIPNEETAKPTAPIRVMGTVRLEVPNVWDVEFDLVLSDTYDYSFKVPDLERNIQYPLSVTLQTELLLRTLKPELAMCEKCKFNGELSTLKEEVELLDTVRQAVSLAYSVAAELAFCNAEDFDQFTEHANDTVKTLNALRSQFKTDLGERAQSLINPAIQQLRREIQLIHQIDRLFDQYSKARKKFEVDLQVDDMKQSLGSADNFLLSLIELNVALRTHGVFVTLDYDIDVPAIGYALESEKIAKSLKAAGLPDYFFDGQFEQDKRVSAERFEDDRRDDYIYRLRRLPEGPKPKHRDSFDVVWLSRNPEAVPTEDAAHETMDSEGSASAHEEMSEQHEPEESEETETMGSESEEDEEEEETSDPEQPEGSPDSWESVHEPSPIIEGSTGSDDSSEADDSTAQLEEMCADLTIKPHHELHPSQYFMLPERRVERPRAHPPPAETALPPAPLPPPKPQSPSTSKTSTRVHLIRFPRGGATRPYKWGQAYASCHNWKFDQRTREQEDKSFEVRFQMKDIKYVKPWSLSAPEQNSPDVQPPSPSSQQQPAQQSQFPPSKECKPQLIPQFPPPITRSTPPYSHRTPQPEWERRRKPRTGGWVPPNAEQWEKQLSNWYDRDPWGVGRRRWEHLRKLGLLNAQNPESETQTVIEPSPLRIHRSKPQRSRKSSKSSVGATPLSSGIRPQLQYLLELQRVELVDRRAEPASGSAAEELDLGSLNIAEHWVDHVESSPSGNDLGTSKSERVAKKGRKESTSNLSESSESGQLLKSRASNPLGRRPHKNARRHYQRRRAEKARRRELAQHQLQSAGDHHHRSPTEQAQQLAEKAQRLAEAATLQAQAAIKHVEGDHRSAMQRAAAALQQLQELQQAESLSDENSAETDGESLLAELAAINHRHNADAESTGVKGFFATLCKKVENSETEKLADDRHSSPEPGPSGVGAFVPQAAPPQPLPPIPTREMAVEYSNELCGEMDPFTRVAQLRNLDAHLTRIANFLCSPKNPHYDEWEKMERLLVTVEDALAALECETKTTDKTFGRTLQSKCHSYRQIMIRHFGAETPKLRTEMDSFHKLGLRFPTHHDPYQLLHYEKEMGALMKRMSRVDEVNRRFGSCFGTLSLASQRPFGYYSSIITADDHRLWGQLVEAVSPWRPFMEQREHVNRMCDNVDEVLSDLAAAVAAEESPYGLLISTVADVKNSFTLIVEDIEVLQAMAANLEPHIVVTDAIAVLQTRLEHLNCVADNLIR